MEGFLSLKMTLAGLKMEHLLMSLLQAACKDFNRGYTGVLDVMLLFSFNLYILLSPVQLQQYM